MKRIFVLGGIILALAACGRSDDKLQCGGYEVLMTMADDGDSLTAVINGDSCALDLVPSADGAKYAGVLNDTNVVLWGQGNSWTLFVGDDDNGIVCK